MKTPAAISAPVRRGFTLIELMVVVAILGMILAMGVPTLYHVLHKEGFRKTVSDMMQLCSDARARAIMEGVPTEIVFHPRQRSCQLVDGAGAKKPSDLPAESTDAVSFGNNVNIKMLDVNLREYKDAPVARVHFYPNGTSDEMTLILEYLGSGRPQWRKISLEITTGLASVDANPNHWSQQ